MTYEQTGANSYRDFAYDDENQLVEIITFSFGNPTTKAEFDYDGKMRLRITRNYSYSGGWNLTSETRYLYDGMLAVQDRDGSNVPTVTYTRGIDLSGTFQTAGGIGGFLGRSHGYSTGTGAWSTHNHYFADGNGNITYLVNSSQSLAAIYRYDPFGNLTAAGGSLWTANLYRFSSKLVHAPSSFYYYGYRFYNPSLQRWLNRDPKGVGPRLFTFLKSAPPISLAKSLNSPAMRQAGKQRRLLWAWPPTNSRSTLPKTSAPSPTAKASLPVGATIPTARSPAKQRQRHPNPQLPLRRQ